MSSYGGSYKPFRINYNKCSKCPLPEIITDINGNDKNTFLKTKKSKCGYALKLGLYHRNNPYKYSQEYHHNRENQTNSQNRCNSLFDQYTDVDGTTKTTEYRNVNCNSETAINKPVVNAFGRISGGPNGSGSRIVNRF